MKAMVIYQYGAAEQLQLAELPLPIPGEGQVRIKVAAAGVNPVDFHVRNGLLKDTGTHQLPLILGWDAAGVIDALGTGVQAWQPGQEVMVFAPIGGQGCYAEYICVDADLLAAKPSQLSMTEAAAVPLAAVTAWQGLFKAGQLQPGQRVYIHGASGGVGGFAVQLAKARGAFVYASCSARSRDYVASLGADVCLDYQQQDFAEQLTELDLLFACVGGNQVLPRALPTLKSGGRLISTFDEIDPALAQAQGVDYQRMWVQPSGADLKQLAELLQSGQLRVQLDQVWPLHQAREALARSESGRALGKVVLQLAAD